MYSATQMDSIALFQFEGGFHPRHEGVKVPHWDTCSMSLHSQVPVSCQKDNHGDHASAVDVCLARSRIDTATTRKYEIIICGL